jgi:hypothetical protein
VADHEPLVADLDFLDPQDVADLLVAALAVGAAVASRDPDRSFSPRM